MKKKQQPPVIGYSFYCITKPKVNASSIFRSADIPNSI